MRVGEMCTAVEHPKYSLRKSKAPGLTSYERTEHSTAGAYTTIQPLSRQQPMLPSPPLALTEEDTISAKDPATKPIDDQHPTFRPTNSARGKENRYGRNLYPRGSDTSPQTSRPHSPTEIHSRPNLSESRHRLRVTRSAQGTS